MQIELAHIEKSLGGKEVLKDISLSVDSGEFHVLLGPSGCGKTTLLRIISGLEQPDSGSVFFDGNDVTVQEPRHRNIGLVFQNFSLYPGKTVFQNIAYPLKLKGIDKAVINQTVDEVSRLLGVRHLLHRFPEKLSGGESQRVAIARTLVKEPEIYLFDEPLSNIDAQQRFILRDELKALQRKTGKTVLYVTHDQEEANALSDRISIMKDGVIQQTGPISTLLEKPVNLFVATFLGRPRINLLKAELASDSKADSIIVLGTSHPISSVEVKKLEQQLGDSKHLPFWLGVRPYHIILSKHHAPGREIFFKAEVTEIQYHPPLYHLHLFTGESEVIAVTDYCSYRIGDAVTCTFSLNDCNAFCFEEI